MWHNEIIQYLIDKYDYQSYLEIGLDNPNNNYLLINCKYKECVDPYYDDWAIDANTYMDASVKKFIEGGILTYHMTSDEMFAQMPNEKKYDIIFIDGYHNEEQVDRDIINSLKHLNKGGRIVVHDCLPENEFQGSEEVPSENAAWMGTVWKSIPKLIFNGIDYYVVNSDCGCGVIKFNGNTDELVIPPKANYEYKDIFGNEMIRNIIMHVVDDEMFFNIEK
jgi:hypothetical protein